MNLSINPNTALRRLLPFGLCAVAISLCPGQVVSSIEYTPSDVGSTTSSTFSVRPTDDPALYFGINYGNRVRIVDFNTAPAGNLQQGGTVSDQYASLGVTMNAIRIADNIYGGNHYGTGFATLPTQTQVITFTTPVAAVGFINTSPDGNLVEFFSGPDGLGNLLHSFSDQEGQSIDFDTDRFIGGRVTSGLPIRSIKIHGNAEIDELILAIDQSAPSAFEWRASVGGNGHYYEVITAAGGIRWEDAKVAAASRGGYLATATSEAENQFIHALAAANEGAWIRSGWILGPWLGGFQPSDISPPDAGWEWVTGEPWQFTSWFAGEPNDFNGDERYISYWDNGGNKSEADSWNDAPIVGSTNGYVVEYNQRPGFVPAPMPLLVPIELRPEDVGDGDVATFSEHPTANPTRYFGQDYGSRGRGVNFNTAPDGTLTEGGSLTSQYASVGVSMNSIRISNDIYGGNFYGAGFAAEHDTPQVYTFDAPVTAVGIINTSPDRDYLEFYSGPGATGQLLYSFRDQEDVNVNFDIDRFVGVCVRPGGLGVRSFRIANATGNLELDELIFAFQTDSHREFAESAESAGLMGTNSLPDADPFDDGVPNLVKYASNVPLNTANPDSVSPEGTSGLPGAQFFRIPDLELGEDQILWRLRFIRKKQGVTYAPEISKTLTEESFQPIGLTPTVTPIDSEWERVTYDIETIGDLRLRAFSRVRFGLGAAN